MSEAKQTRETLTRSVQGVERVVINAVMPIKEACKQVGAVICEWSPEESDQCETCGKKNTQMYYIRESYEYDEGSYHCKQCIKEMPKKQEDYWQGFCDHIEEMRKKDAEAL